MEGVTGIDIKPHTIGAALCQSRLRLDINQREYSWEEDHVRELYQDFSDVITEGAPGTEHFLGSIVVTLESGGFSKVVDGQQRLATSLILLAAIRDYVYLHDVEERATALSVQFLITVDPDTLEPLPHLKLSGFDNDYFKKRILSLPGSQERGEAKIERTSHGLIDQAANIAMEFISQAATSGRKGHSWPRLQIWKDFVLKRARVIWVQVPDDLTAFRIFETMNDRGLGLSQAYLIKNFLLYTIKDDDQTEAYAQWIKMQGAIESVSDDKKMLVTYIRHYWLSAKGHTTADELYAHINRKIRTKVEALDLISNLNSSASTYAALLTTDNPFWVPFPETLRYQVSALHGLRVGQVRPLLLAGVKAFKGDHKELEKFFKSLVSWSVRFLISGGGGGGVMENRYGAAAREITAGKIKTVKQLTDHFTKVVPPDLKFEGDFINAQVSQSYLIKYYLRTLEEHLSGEQEPHFDLSKRGFITPEHILPKSGKGYDPIIALTYKNRLGNIALLQRTKNVDIGDKSYSVKRPILAASKYLLTQEAASKTKWGPEEILERQTRLAKLAVKAWPIKV